MIDLADTYVHEKAVSSKFAAATKMEFLNCAVRELVNEVRDVFPYFGMVSTTIDQTQGTETTSMISDLDRVIHMRGNTDKSQEVLYQNMLTDLGSGWSMTDKDFVWINYDTTGTYEVQYTRLPWDCHYGTAAAFAATTVTITVSATGPKWSGGGFYNDYYNGCKLYALSSTTNYGQEFTVTDFAGSTGVFTGTWDGDTPTGEGTLVYEVQPMINPREWYQLLAWEVALMMKSIGRGEDAPLPRNHPYKRLRQQFITKYRSRSERMPGYGAFRGLSRT